MLKERLKISKQKIALIISLIFFTWFLVDVSRAYNQRTLEVQKQKQKYESLQEQNENLEKYNRELEQQNADLKKQAAEKVRLASDLMKVSTSSITQASSVRVVQNVENWRPLVAKYFPASQVDNALLTMKLESGGNPRAVSATDDHGLFQFNHGLTNYGQTIYDPEFNVRLAADYYSRRGWTPWYAVRGVLW